MAATTTLISLEEYLRTSYKPDCDFVDGQLQERNMGEYPHSRIQLRIGSWFLTHEREWNINPVTEQRIQVTGDHVRICDVCVLRGDAPHEAVTLTPPLLCIEILSPEDRLSRAAGVLEDYRLMGVPHIWLIDPLRRAAHIYDAKGLHAALSERLEIPGTAIHLMLPELFAGLD